jgi:hypothetical protein
MMLAMGARMKRLDPAQIAAILRATGGTPPFPRHTERSGWQARAATPVARAIVARAGAALAEPTPTMGASDFLAFQRTGDREPFETPHIERRTRIRMSRSAIW